MTKDRKECVIKLLDLAFKALDEVYTIDPKFCMHFVRRYNDAFERAWAHGSDPVEALSTIAMSPVATS